MACGNKIVALMKLFDAKVQLFSISGSMGESIHDVISLVHQTQKQGTAFIYSDQLQRVLLSKFSMEPVEFAYEVGLLDGLNPKFF